MKIVTEDYAETLGVARDRSHNALVAAAVGHVLRLDLNEDFVVPDQFLALVRTLDGPVDDASTQVGRV